MRVHPQLCSRCSVASVRQEPRVLATAQSLDTRPDTSAHACGAVLFAGPRPDTSAHACGAVLFAGARVLATAQSLDTCWGIRLQGFFWKRVCRVSFFKISRCSEMSLEGFFFCDFRVYCRRSRFGILCFYMSTVFGNESEGFLFLAISVFNAEITIRRHVCLCTNTVFSPAFQVS
jgi:hypothetical protein